MNYKVVIIDDDLVALFLHKSFVIKSGLDLQPECYSNAREALEHVMKFTSSESRRLLILLDINMPEFSGWQFLESLPPSLEPITEVVIVSSSINVADYQKAKSFATVKSYMEKPVTVEKLKMLTQTALIANHSKIEHR